MMKGKVGNIPLGKGVRVVAEDPSGLIALFKPAGVLSHPNTAKDVPRALLRLPYDLTNECYDGKQSGTEEGDFPRKIWLLNRLDSATSGVLLCADQIDVAETVRGLFAQGRVSKKYYALVFGTLSPAKQVWKDRLRVSREGGRLRTSGKGEMEAETEVRVERVFPGRYAISLIELRPKSGRTHQLRVQCAKRGLPMVGDQTYGNFAWNKEFIRATGRKRLFLHSAEIGLSLDSGARKISFSASAPLPREFAP